MPETQWTLDLLCVVSILRQKHDNKEECHWNFPLNTEVQDKGMNNAWNTSCSQKDDNIISVRICEKGWWQHNRANQTKNHKVHDNIFHTSNTFWT
jgi:hypothetical protein